MSQQLLDAIAPGDVGSSPRPSRYSGRRERRGAYKPEILAALKPLSPGLIGRLKVDDFQFTEIGDVAFVSHEDDEYLDYHGQILLSRFRMTDTWHRTADAWRLLGSQALAVAKHPSDLPRCEIIVWVQRPVLDGP